MTEHKAMLHLLCGKIASGKSTLSKDLGKQPGTIIIVEDDWLSLLFDDQLKSGSDYLRCSGRLKAALGPHVVSLLRNGLSVVLDFAANTIEGRAWMKEMVEAAEVDHALHHLDVSDEICLKRLHARNAGGEHAFKVSDEMFHQFTKHFAPPKPEEGFNVIVHRTEESE